MASTADYRPADGEVTVGVRPDRTPGIVDVSDRSSGDSDLDTLEASITGRSSGVGEVFLYLYFASDGPATRRVGGLSG